MDSREVVLAIDAILKEKKIDKSKLSEIVESIFTTILKKKYEIENEEVEKYFTVTFNIDRGDVEIIHERVVVTDDDFEDELSQIKLTDALKIDDDAEVGEELPEIIDFNSFGRRHIIAAKQILGQKIKKEEKNNLYEAFQDRVGEILTGSIHSINSRDLKITFEDVELFMPRTECVFNERYRKGDLIRTYVKDVAFRNQDVKIIVSRADSNFIKKLFELEVPEISDGVINIVKIARRPGLRTKVVLETLDNRVDPVGACVGQRGSRISAIVSELNKEKVDIVQMIEEPNMFITRLLGIKTEYQIDINEESSEVEIVIADNLYRDVMGYRNSNIELAEEISGYKIKVITESEFEKQNELLLVNVEEFKNKLSPELLEVLNNNGFANAENIFAAEDADLLAVDGIDDEKLKFIRETLEKYYKD